MIEPSSSSESENEDDLNPADSFNDGKLQDSDSLSIASGSNLTQQAPLSARNSRESPKPLSHAPSITSLNSLQENNNYDEDAERKERLQIYVFVSRCIAYPFNAKQQTDMPRRQNKVTKQNLVAVKERFTAFLNGQTNIIADEAFRNSVLIYHESFLSCDRVAKMVNSGGYSSSDFREIFKSNIEKRVRSLPEIEGLSKETVLTSWMAKFDAIYRGDEDQKRTPSRLAATAASELILSKEQLYEMFQQILQAKKYEHQSLFNALMLDNADEQAACIRRELHGRLKALEVPNKARKRGFIHKNMEGIYIEEQKALINQLMGNLESFPVGKTGSDGKSALYKMRKVQNNAISMMEVPEDSEALMNKVVVGLTFNLQVVVKEACGLEVLPSNRVVFVVMELEGDAKLQTDQAEAGKPIWETQGDWTIAQPLPVLKLRLMAENNALLSFDHKELAKVTISPHCGLSDAYEWYPMVASKGWGGDKVRLLVSVKMEKPQIVKKCGYLYVQGQSIWKEWKKRYFMLIQASQYLFTLCSYQLKKAQPTKVMGLDGYTVDFSEPIIDEEHQGGRYFFKAVKEGDLVYFASDEDIDRQQWVYNLYNATGQSHKPVAPKLPAVALHATTSSTLQRVKGDAEVARKYGLDYLIQADPSEFDHSKLFEHLQKMTLMHRLGDSYTCLGWFSPGQVFVLDEYCARYGVRGCHRHLCYLDDLLDKAESGIMIDPTLLHYSYAFCASHVLGNRPDGVNTVTSDEKERYKEIKLRLQDFIASQITHFRYCFPFGRPEGALKSTLTLYETVLRKEAMTPMESEEVQLAVRKCLRNAALVNYNGLSTYEKISEITGTELSSDHKLQKVSRLAELCIELIQQNEEHHLESLTMYSDLMVEHTEVFWSLYAVDMDSVLECQPPDSWDSFSLFQMLNNYLRMEETLNNGPFHKHLTMKFSPLVVRYIDLMESSIARSLDKGFSKEKWEPCGESCTAAEDVFWKLRSIQAFIQDLHWPEEDFALHLNNRLRLVASDMTEACINRVVVAFEALIKSIRVSLNFLIPFQMCVMLNVLSHSEIQSNILCSCEENLIEQYRYHSNVKDLVSKSKQSTITALCEKMCGPLQSILKKLARYDQGSLTSAVLSLVTPDEELASRFLDFISANLKVCRATIRDQGFVLFIIKIYWDTICSLLCGWLTERQDVPLHIHQLRVLSEILEVTRKLFEEEGVDEKSLENDSYKASYSKLQVEEAMLHLSEPGKLTRNIGYESYKSRANTMDSDGEY